MAIKKNACPVCAEQAFFYGRVVKRFLLPVVVL